MTWLPLDSQMFLSVGLDVILLLGRERTVERLRHAAERLEAESPARTS